MTGGGLRFAMVTTFYPPHHFGGDGQFVRRLTHALARRGHQVDVIHDVDAFRMLGGNVDCEPLQEPEGVRVHALRSPLGALSCVATQQFGRPLVHGHRIQDILRKGFDVIHFHNISLVGGPGILAYGGGVKLYTAHEHWLVCPSHILWRHNRELCTGRECLRCVLRHSRPPQLWRSGSLLQRQSRHVDAFLALSQFSADKHREFGFDRSMFVMPSFLPDSERKDEGDLLLAKAPDDRPYFLFVGRLEAIKGLQDVIPLFNEDSPAGLWIAGSGGYEPELRKLAIGRKGVRFLGQQTPEQLRQLYRNAVAVVTPSICYEVFPMVILEAFREGTPIVARRLGPYPEIVDQSHGGLLFETAEELKGALTTLATNDQVREKLGKAGARAFETYWSEAVAMKSYFELIYRIAQTRGIDQILDKFPKTNGVNDLGESTIYGQNEGSALSSSFGLKLE